MLRLGDVGEGIDAVGVDAQGTTVRRSGLFRVTHGYTPCIGAERQQQTSKYQYITFHNLSMSLLTNHDYLVAFSRTGNYSNYID